MLSPDSRTLLLDALRPPPDYTLDHAIGTTYSLDLMALLTAPVAFTLFQLQGDSGQLAADPVTLIHALIGYAEKISIFCDAGRIKVPTKPGVLMAYLEHAVHPVYIENGTFHPKVWIIRYQRTDGDYKYRLLCLSRNLTYDHSWDTALVLDGYPSNARRRENLPLIEFIRQLPKLAQQPITESLSEVVEQFQAELQDFYFEPPAEFDAVAFFPLGRSRDQDPFYGINAIDQLLIASPFLSSEPLERLTKLAKGKKRLVANSDSYYGLPQQCLSHLGSKNLGSSSLLMNR